MLPLAVLEEVVKLVTAGVVRDMIADSSSARNASKQHEHDRARVQQVELIYIGQDPRGPVPVKLSLDGKMHHSTVHLTDSKTSIILDI